MKAWLQFMRWLACICLLAGSACSGEQPTPAPSPTLKSRRMQEQRKSGGDQQPVDSEQIVERFKVATDGSSLLLPVELKGKHYWFALDTGASSTIYDTCFRALLGDPIKTQEVWTPGRYVTIPIFRSPKITVGKLSLPPDAKCICTNLERLRESSGQEVFGFIGMDFLRKYVIRFDFDSGEVTFLTRIGSNAGNRVPIVFQCDVPYIMVGIGGLPEQVQFLVDTGCKGFSSGYMRDDYFDTLAKRGFLKLDSQSSIETVVEKRGIRYGCLSEINLAGFRRQNLRFGELNENVLGLNYLSRFVVTFDFPNSVMYLEKGRQYEKIDPLDRSGVDIVRRKGQVVVESVDGGSPAALAGIRAQDVLLKIDDGKSTEMSLIGIRRLFCEKNREFRLLVRRGERELELILSLREEREGLRTPRVLPGTIEPSSPKASPNQKR